jgi:hypothetical protein
MRPLTAILLASAAISGCTSAKLNNALGTPKNPTPIFAFPDKKKLNPSDQTAVIMPLYEVLLNSSTQDKLKEIDVDESEIRPYLTAGFALSDIYCARFFVKTDESYRRRKFGRALSNDVGTLMSTVLGLANAGENVVTGVAAGFGLFDSTWRNYDDSFVISPQLANVRSLVIAAQDNFRTRTLGPDVTLPSTFGAAQSVLLRYADLCSFLGMQAILEQAAAKQRTELNDDTDRRNKPSPTPTPTPGATGTRAPTPAPTPAATPRPEGAVLRLTP